MFDPGASECPECPGRLGKDGACQNCGWKPAEPAPPKAAIPIHRPVPERTWERSKPTDRCPECGVPVAEHMREVRELVAKIGRAR